jgi:hypothetical protein
MKRIAPIWKSAVFAAATVAAMGFGAAQAFAAPPSEEKAATCSTWACPECGSFGGQWVPAKGICYCCG